MGNEAPIANSLGLRMLYFIFLSSQAKNALCEAQQQED